MVKTSKNRILLAAFCFSLISFQAKSCEKEEATIASIKQIEKLIKETKLTGDKKAAFIVQNLYPLLISASADGCGKALKELTGHVDFRVKKVDMLLQHGFIIAALKGHHEIFKDFQVPGKLFGSSSWKPQFEALAIAYGCAVANSHDETAQAILKMTPKNKVENLKNKEALKSNQQITGQTGFVTAFDFMIENVKGISHKEEYKIADSWNQYLNEDNGEQGQ